LKPQNLIDLPKAGAVNAGRINISDDGNERIDPSDAGQIDAPNVERNSSELLDLQINVGRIGVSDVTWNRWNLSD